jgi:hypothetical protein
MTWQEVTIPAAAAAAAGGQVQLRSTGGAGVGLLGISHWVVDARLRAFRGSNACSARPQAVVAGTRGAHRAAALGLLGVSRQVVAH